MLFFPFKIYGADFYSLLNGLCVDWVQCSSHRYSSNHVCSDSNYSCSDFFYPFKFTSYSM